MTRWRFALHLIAILVLAVGVCVGVFARWPRPVMSGTDIKHLVAGADKVTVATPQYPIGVAVPKAGLFDALPDAAEFGPPRPLLQAEPGTMVVNCYNRCSLSVDHSHVWLFMGERGWARANVGPAVAARLRAALNAAAGDATKGAAP